MPSYYIQNAASKSTTQVHCRSVHPTNQPSIGPSGCAFVGTFDAASKVHLKWEQSQSSEFQNSNFKQTQFGATLGTQGLSVNQPLPDVVVGGFNICINLS